MQFRPPVEVRSTSAHSRVDCGCYFGDSADLRVRTGRRRKTRNAHRTFSSTRLTRKTRVSSRRAGSLLSCLAQRHRFDRHGGALHPCDPGGSSMDWISPAGSFEVVGPDEGFYPDFTGTSEKAGNRPGGVSCQSAENSGASSNGGLSPAKASPAWCCRQNCRNTKLTPF